MQRFYETNRVNHNGSAIGSFDKINECIRTWVISRNEINFLENRPTIMFFQCGFGEPLILTITRKDYIDHAIENPKYTTDSRWFGPKDTKLCNTVLMFIEKDTRHSYLLSEQISSAEGKLSVC